MKYFTRPLLSVLLLTALFLGSLPASTVRAASYNVTNLLNSGDGSLRKAIEDANGNIGADTITINPALTGTITLASELDITGPVTITGPGANKLTVSGNNVTRVFSVRADTTISGLTIMNGRTFGENGAGIEVVSGTLSLDKVTITTNFGVDSAENIHSLGGGIYVSSLAHLNLTNSAVVQNEAFSGSAIYVAGSASLVNSTISGNKSHQVFILNDVLTPGSDGGYGAVFNKEGGSMVLVNVTITNNWAFHFEGGLTPEASSESAYSTTSLSNTIISGNTSNDTSPADIFVINFAHVTSNQHNLIGDSGSSYVLPESVALGTLPRVDPLGTSMGGTTPYHALQSNSLAINQGATADAPASDQRGYYRPNQADIGAFEYNGQAPAIPTLSTPTFAFVSSTTATLGATIDTLGVPAVVTERGIYWSTTTPVGLTQKISRFGTFDTPETFTISVSGLPSSTLIYYKAFATNATGTGFSEEDSFTTGSGPNDEPSFFPLAITAAPTGPNSIRTEVTPSDEGGQAPDGYLVLCSQTASFTTPSDHTPVADHDCGAGSGAVNIAASASLIYDWASLSADTLYTFTVFPYTNSGGLIDYKTVGDRPTGSATTAKVEPSNYPASLDAAAFSAVQLGDYVLDVTFPASTGTVVPDGYLLFCATSSSFTPPVDFIAQAGDVDCKTGGSGVKVILAGSLVNDIASYRWTGLDAGTVYYFRVYPYTNADTLIDYKTGPTPPTTSARTDKAEPSNYPTGLTATTDSASQITTSWTDAIGTVTPDRYLILCRTANSFTDPVDGSAPVDANCADGSGAVLVQGAQSYAWTGLTGNTPYYFKIFSATNAGSHINYKVDSAPPTANATTLNIATPTNLVVSAVRQNRFTVQWGAVASATDYYLDVATDANFTQMVPGYNNQKMGNVTQAVVSGLAAHTTYYVRVRSHDGNLTSLSSLLATTKTLWAFFMPNISH